ncbi:cytochrome P450 71A25 [Citrus sinensis]|nr:cytochrome P450 71A25 [Citrus sinensis]
MFMHLGHSPTLVVSSAEITRDIIKNHDIVFSNRPKTTAGDVLLYGSKDIGFSSYGEYWREARKTCVLGLLSNKKVQSLHYVKEEEVAIMINKIRSSCLSRGSVSLAEMLQTVTNNIVSRSVLGRRVEEESTAGGKSNKFGELSKRLLIQLGSISFRDLFPSFGWLDVVTGHIGRLKATTREFDALFDQVIEEHRISAMSHEDNDQSDKKDLVYALLKLQKDGKLGIELTQDNLKALLLDMFTGGTQTTATTVEWAMAELAKNPKLLKKAQEEVRRVVKNKSSINMDDVDQMHYLKCVIKESLRLHPAGTISFPRETSTSVNLGGYDIPAKTIVYMNVWAIQRDPKVWDRAEEFLPERFINSTIDFNGQHFDFIPFGTGRRFCPGMLFGKVAAEYLLANLLYWFDWKLPGGAVDANLDMTEEYGLAVTKKHPLILMPTLYSP